MQDTAGFVLYSDISLLLLRMQAINPGHSISIAIGVVLYLLDEEASQYQVISFDFIPNKDLSLLKMQGYALDFKMKGNDPNTGV